MSQCIIPARGGSQRIPRKNIRDFHGKPIIAYSIEAALESGLFKDIIVSTDDEDIAAAAEHYGATKIHVREEKDARDEVGTQEIAAKVLEAMDNVWTYTCVIYPCAPLLRPIYLLAGLAMIEQAYHSINYIYPVDLSGNDVGMFYWGSSYAFINRIPLDEDDNTGYMILPDNFHCDINTEKDWQRALKLYEEMR
jgi:pseudaminic acid cytidylyltransferase